MNQDKTDILKLFILALAMIMLTLTENDLAQQLKPNEKLAMAVLTNDFQGVKDALSKGADINAANESGETVIFTALTASFSQLDKFSCDMIRLLIDSGANVNIKNHEGQTPLFIACSQGLIPDNKRAELTALLISGGADTEIKANVHMFQEGTPLLYAAMNGYVSTMNVLIEHGADPLVKDDFANNALWWVIKGDPAAISISDKQEIIRILLSKGADPLNRNETGETALSFAEESGSKLLADALKGKKAAGKQERKNVITRSDPENNSSFLTPVGKLTAAVKLGDLNGVKKAFEEGAEITLRDENGNTPLHLAADFTLDIISGNENKGSAEQLNSRLEIIKFLINNGAEVNAINHLSENALAVAVKTALFSGGKKINKFVIEAVRYLVSKGSAVDNDATTTPLMDACDAASAELVDILVPHVKNINKKSDDIIKMTPLAFAIGTEAMMLAGVKAFKKWMKESDSKIAERKKYSEGIRVSSDPARLIIIKSLIKHGADVNLASGGVKPLTQAKTAGFNEIAEFLKNCGAKE